MQGQDGKTKATGGCSQAEAESKRVKAMAVIENGKTREAGGRAELLAVWTRPVSAAIGAAGFKTAVWGFTLLIRPNPNHLFEES